MHVVQLGTPASLRYPGAEAATAAGMLAAA
jgi:hypothetical protein